MYKRVIGPQDQSQFDSIWQEAWLEKGFELEPSNEESHRLLILDDETAVGTVEFKRYIPGYASIDQVAPFQASILLRESPDAVMEVDKVAILKAHRGKHIGKMLTAMTLFAEQEGIRYFVSLLDPVFYRALKVSFRIPIDCVSEDRPYYKGARVVPAILHVHDVYGNKERYPWLVPSHEFGQTEKVAI
ncbi:GNAT family N-acetyltransferase [Cohnella faecalis]|nr:GNAT family N-acetyltransferase [Cohnella faecalis]